MSVGDILLLVGLALGTVAGVLLAYDAIYGAGAEFQHDMAANSLAILRRSRASNQHILRNLGGSYTDEDRQRELDQEEAEWGPQEAELAAKVDAMPLKYRDKVSNLAVRGVFLLIASFVLQFIGTLLLALAHEDPPPPPSPTCQCSTTTPGTTTPGPKPDTGPQPPPPPDSTPQPPPDSAPPPSPRLGIPSGAAS